MRSVSHILSLRFGKTILVCQAVMVAAGMCVFVKTVPWLLSDDISEIGMYDDPKPPPPSWAKAYWVDHGTFRYFRESRSDAPFQAAACIVLILASTAGATALSYWAKHQSPRIPADRHPADDAKATHPHREELMQFIAKSLEIGDTGLCADTHFREDLRVPPGEMEGLMEEIGDHFGVSIEPIGVQTIGDLLRQIEPDAD